MQCNEGLRVLDCVVNLSLPGRGEDGLRSKSMNEICVLYRSNALNEITKQRSAVIRWTGLLKRGQT